MGVSIQAKKSPARTIDMGYGGFLRLRNRVAMLAGEPWASHYLSLIEEQPFQSQTFCEAFDAKTEEMLEQGLVNAKLVDFCLQSDTGGTIRYGACKALLDVIGDYNDDVLYGYAARTDCAMFKDFKAVLRECVEKKCDLVWW